MFVDVGRWYDEKRAEERKGLMKKSRFRDSDCALSVSSAADFALQESEKEKPKIRVSPSSVQIFRRRPLPQVRLGPDMASHGE